MQRQNLPPAAYPFVRSQLHEEVLCLVEAHGGNREDISEKDVEPMDSHPLDDEIQGAGRSFHHRGSPYLYVDSSFLRTATMMMRAACSSNS